MFELNSRVWICPDCNTIVLRKKIGNYKPRVRYKCLCKEITVTAQEMEATKGRIKNDRCLEKDWVRARIIAVKGMPDE